jgi:glyoxylase-like metal-dependent hydrolase (beta-lactamase superfamily II)
VKLHILDTRFQGMPHVTAVYLVIGPEGPVLIETGPASTTHTVVAALADHGYIPEDIRAALVTHIHLDHAGAAGWWAQQGVPVYVHHVGAPHLIDPSKLLLSASRIYGELMGPLWGETVPAPAEMVTPVYDGQIVRAGGLDFIALDTPGHANHHHTWRLRDYTRGEIAFTGDAAGISLPDVGLADLPAPPPEFHMESWLSTLDRLEAGKFVALYPTHYGQVTDVHGHISSLRTLMVDAVAFVEERWRSGAERDQLVNEYLDWNRRRAASFDLSPTAVEQYALANPPVMSIDGILRYLRKKYE